MTCATNSAAGACDRRVIGVIAGAITFVVAGSLSGCDNSGTEQGVDARVTPAAQQQPDTASKQTAKKKEQTENDTGKKVPIEHSRTPDSSIRSKGGTRVAPPARQPNASSPPANGQLVFDKMNHDFGRAAFGEALKTTFPFKNTGTETLVIDRVRSSCGCTVPELSKKEYAPGETGQIEVTFKPKGIGRQTKSITVVSNAKDSSRLVLTVSAETVDVVRTKPRLVQFGEVLRGTDRTVDLVLESIDPEMTIVSASFKRPDPTMTAEIVKDATAPEGSDPKMPGYGLIKVTVHDDAPLGRMLRTLEVVCKARMQGETEAKERTINVNTHVTVVGDLKSSPATLRIPTVNKGEEFKGSIILTRRSEKTFKIKEVMVERSTIPGVEVSFEPWESNDGTQGYRVWVSGKDDEFKGVYRGYVRVATDIEDEEPLSIAFSGAVRAAAKRPATTGGTRR